MKKISIIIVILIFIIVALNQIIGDKDLIIDKIKDTKSNKDIVLLFDEEKINLQFDNKEVGVKSIPKDLIDDYEYSLKIIGNYLLVGMINKKTVKYSSLTFLYLYDYIQNPITKIWSTDDELKKELFLKNYNTTNNTIIVDSDSSEVIIEYDEKIENKLMEFIKSIKEKDKKIQLEISNTVAYCIYDYDKDGQEELITKSIVTMGFSPLVDTYYSVYKIEDNGIQKVKSCFYSKDNTLEKYFKNFN
ncbi:hypothetical protein [Vallitalea guaymasensis]|uniref:Uncharacterized protein n=1 Tax=Vallitalea guaymasensis TaxID=1185412 RepID=A0A8J8MDB1_9FIRM|nr:hypothetical protein [Vallitalea guaymasensis]QUH30585.1 hypothetical protein HYG85_17370 [Vallitalea guaymasensis]